MAYCKHCWNELEKNVKFCEHCGAPASPVDYKKPVIKIIIRRVIALLLSCAIAVLYWMFFINGVKVGECTKLWNADCELWQSKMSSQVAQSLTGTIRRHAKDSTLGKNVFVFIDTVGEASTEIVDGILEVIPAPTPATLSVKTDAFGTVKGMTVKIPPQIAAECTKDDITRITAKAASVMCEHNNYDDTYKALKNVGTVDKVVITTKGSLNGYNGFEINIEYAPAEE